jgi:hypothetical protein
MKFTVTATYTTAITVDIDESNTTQAYLKACEMSLSDFEQVKDSGVLKVHDITLSDANFSDEQLAFMTAYQNSVAVAERDTVKKYMVARDRENFDGDDHPDYSNITDAHEVWDHARRFFTK